MNYLSKLALNNEIQELVTKSKPIPGKELPLAKIECDLSVGNFDFYFKNQNNVEKCINLTFYACHINVVLDFLTALTAIKTPICNFIEDEGMHGIFYAELMDNNMVRFLVADDYELYLKFCQNKVPYSFANCNIILDILIDKDELVKQFYKKLWEKIKDYKTIVYEPYGNRIDKESKKLIEQLNKYTCIQPLTKENGVVLKTMLKISILKKIILIISILALGGYSLFIEPNKLEVNHYTLQDAELNGVKIVFASDFHIKPNQENRLDKIVKLINSEKPDLVLSVGDYVSGHNKNMTMPIEDITKELGKVKSKYGFYTTLGNHDGWYGVDYIAKNLEKNGIKVLANENISIPIKNKTVYIAGVEDLMTGKPDIYKALENTKTPVILLTHSPDIFPKLQYSVNLALAGHTHGGQVRLPLLGPIFTASRYGDKYSKGLTVAKNGNKMITTKGIGTSILPIRFNCVPEIIVIDFE